MCKSSFEWYAHHNKLVRKHSTVTAEEYAKLKKSYLSILMSYSAEDYIETDN
jgi:hypothetical protein